MFKHIFDLPKILEKIINNLLKALPPAAKARIATRLIDLLVLSIVTEIFFVTMVIMLKWLGA